MLAGVGSGGAGKLLAAGAALALPAVWLAFQEGLADAGDRRLLD
jgi:hypothetical protein